MITWIVSLLKMKVETISIVAKNISGKPQRCKVSKITYISEVRAHHHLVLLYHSPLLLWTGLLPLQEEKLMTAVDTTSRDNLSRQWVSALM